MDNMQEFKKVALEMGYDPQDVESFSSTVGSQEMGVPEFKDEASQLGYEPEEISTFSKVAQDTAPSTKQYIDLGDRIYDGSSIGAVPLLTQPFGAKHARYNNISGGVNRGADFGVGEGTPLFAPEGADWEVVDSYSGAQGRGMQNNGYGNSVLLRNTQTGEQVRMSHLSQVAARPGSIIKGGAPIGLSGQTGHATGPHVDVEYIDQQGKLSDVLGSPYSHQFIKK